MKKFCFPLLRIFPIILYFVIWYLFGCIYQDEANKTSGASFIFQEDLKTSSKIQAFETQTKLNVPDEYIKALLEREDLLNGIYTPNSLLKALPNHLLKNSSNQPTIFSNTPLGSEWARYYVASLELQDITHFSISMETSRDFLRLLSPFYKGTPVNLTFYKSQNPENFVFNPDPKSLEVSHEYRLIVQEKPRQPIAEGNNDTRVQFIPIRLAQRFLEESLVFPDDKVLILKDISEGQYEYPLVDFLYFSAVTITTLGYGDILPATSHVRLLVMIETLVGVVLIGTFISMLFWIPEPPAPEQTETSSGKKR